jgi:hypothetical protein
MPLLHFWRKKILCHLCVPGFVKPPLVDFKKKNLSFTNLCLLEFRTFFQQSFSLLWDAEILFNNLSVTSGIRKFLWKISHFFFFFFYFFFSGFFCLQASGFKWRRLHISTWCLLPGFTIFDCTSPLDVFFQGLQSMTPYLHLMSSLRIHNLWLHNSTWCLLPGFAIFGLTVVAIPARIIAITNIRIPHPNGRESILTKLYVCIYRS